MTSDEVTRRRSPAKAVARLRRSASTFAKEFGARFGHEMSVEARQAQPFGYTTVSRFAHLELEDCQE
jgi:hypothetical protein